MAVWPSLPALSPNNFLDHFPGSSLDSTKWGSVTSGSGAVSLTDSYVDLNAPASSAAFIYRNAQLDKTKSQLWLACLSRVSSTTAVTPTISLLDNFNRTENPLSDGGNWTTGSVLSASTGLKTNGTQAIRQDASGTFGRNGSYWNALTFSAGQSCEVGCTVGNAGSDGTINLTLFNPSTNNGYALFVNVGSFASPNACSLEIYTSGSTPGAALATGTRGLTVGDKIALQIDGNDIVAWHDIGSGWVEFMRVTDTTHREAFNPGLEIAGFADVTSAAADDFGANAITSSPSLNPAMWLLNGASAPTADTIANIDAKALIERGFSSQTSLAVLDSYFSSGGSRTYWGAATPAWTTTFASTLDSLMPVQNDDYYVLGLEIDGVNQRWRLLGWGQAFATAGTWTFNQGWRLFALTDWVNWSATRSSSNVWLCLGQLYTNDPGAHDFRVEWVRYAEAPAGNTVIDGWAAGKATLSDFHQIRHIYSYDGLTYVPQDRTSWALPFGAGSPDNLEVQEPCVVYDGAATDWMFYTGTNSGGPTKSICVASASHVAAGTGQNAAFTRFGSNPILSLGTSGQFDDRQVGFACVVCDQSEANPAKRWKMLYTGQKVSDLKHRMGLATAPAPTGPWTKQGMVLDVGGVGADDANDVFGMSLVYYGGQWEVWYSGGDASGVRHLMRATSRDGLATLTKDATYYTPPTSATDQALTANLSTAPGRTVTVGSTTGFQVDAAVVLCGSSDNDTYSTSKIRKIVSSTVLELYHGLTGFTTGSTPAARIKQLDSGASFDPRGIFWNPNSNEWWLYNNLWEPFLNSAETASYQPLLEEAHLFKHSAAAPNGATFAIQYQPSPVTSRGFNSDEESFENMSLLLPPAVTVDPAARTVRVPHNRVGPMALRRRYRMGRWTPFASSTNQTYQQPLAGGLTFAGSSSRTTSKQLAGGLSFAGAIGRAVAYPLVAALSFSGAAGKATTRAVAGSLSFAGQAAKTTQRSVSAALSFTGSMATGSVFTRALTATLSFSGSVSRSTTKTLAAGLSFTGAIRRSVTHTLAAGLSFAGGMVRTVSYPLTAALGFSGTVAKQTARKLAGTLSFAGSIATGSVFVRALTATLGFSGSMARQTTKSLQAALSFSGGMARLTSALLAGSVSFAGSCVKQTRRSVGAALSFAGSIAKSTSTTFAATLGFSGAVAAARSKFVALTASLGFSGSMQRTTVKQLAGGLGFSGAISRRLARPFTAAVTFTGQAAKTTTRKLAAAVSFAGAVSSGAVVAAFTSIVAGPIVKGWQTLSLVKGWLTKPPQR